jgi:hypothetical protein
MLCRSSLASSMPNPRPFAALQEVFSAVAIGGIPRNFVGTASCSVTPSRIVAYVPVEEPSTASTADSARVIGRWIEQ